jgi:hypothetical protein
VSETNEERLEELSWQAQDLPEGDAKIKLLEEALRYADLSQDKDAMFDARMELIQAATFGGRIELALNAFAWTLAQYESDNQRYEHYHHDLLWDFKWILGNVDQMPDISQEDTERLFERMREHYAAAGYNMRPIENLRFTLADAAGENDEAAKALKLARSIPRDDMADCEACEADQVTDYYAGIDEYEKAVESAGPNLRGERVCGEVPHRTYGHVLRPLAKLGRTKEADEYQRKGYRLIRGNPEFLGQVALHIAYLSHRGRIRAAVGTFSRHLEWSIDTHSLGSRLNFLFASLGLLRRLRKDKQQVKLKIPKAFELYTSDGKYDLDELIAWLDKESQELAQRFDKRNGNSCHREELPRLFDY